MSCRHDLANGTCGRCYPGHGDVDPGPEEAYEPNLDGPGAVPKIEAKDKEIFEIQIWERGGWCSWDGHMYTIQEVRGRLAMLRTNPSLSFRIAFKVFADVGEERPRKQCCQFHRSGGRRTAPCDDHDIHEYCPVDPCGHCDFRTPAEIVEAWMKQSHFLPPERDLADLPTVRAMLLRLVWFAIGHGRKPR